MMKWLAAPLIAAMLSLPAMLSPALSTPRPSTNERSVREWARCDGRTDDRDALAKALAAAANGAFTLRVDCALRVPIGSDIARPLFIDSGTTVRFTPAGSVTVDNVFIPAFVIANSSRIRLDGWRVRYVGRVPISPDVPGFMRAGVFTTRATKFALPGAFNDLTLTEWLAAHRGIRFARAHAAWPGPAQTMAVFYLTGPSRDIQVTGMRMSVPAGVGLDRYIPVAWQVSPGWLGDTTVTDATTLSPATAALPSGVVVRDFAIDGYMMGWVGQLQQSSFTRIRAWRYADLQGPNGTLRGGVGLWFPPPHLLYFRSQPRPTGMIVRHLTITDVVDHGLVQGVARDRQKANRSGNACSLKLGADDTLVDGYVSDRPDGIVQPTEAHNVTLRHISGSYDSSYLNGVTGAIAFPGGPYERLLIEHVRIIDTARAAQSPPVVGTSYVKPDGIVMRDVIATMRRPSAAALVSPGFPAGSRIDIAIRPPAGIRARR